MSALHRVTCLCQKPLDRPNPGVDFRLWRLLPVAALRVELNLRRATHLGTPSGGSHILDDMARPAAVGHKRHHSFNIKYTFKTPNEI